jgi:hypothetical protein
MMAFMMNKLAMINYFEIILENQKQFFLPKIIVKFRCAIYLYGHNLIYKAQNIYIYIYICSYLIEIQTV